MQSKRIFHFKIYKFSNIVGEWSQLIIIPKSQRMKSVIWHKTKKLLEENFKSVLMFNLKRRKTSTANSNLEIIISNQSQIWRNEIQWTEKIIKASRISRALGEEWKCVNSVSGYLESNPFIFDQKKNEVWDSENLAWSCNTQKKDSQHKRFNPLRPLWLQKCFRFLILFIVEHFSLFASYFHLFFSSFFDQISDLLFINSQSTGPHCGTSIEMLRSLQITNFFAFLFATDAQS